MKHKTLPFHSSSHVPRSQLIRATQLMIPILLILVKVAYVHKEIHLLADISQVMLASGLLLAILYLPTLLMTHRWQQRTSISLNLTLTTILLLDLIHYRYFQTPIPLESLRLISHAKRVTASILTVIKVRDIVLYLDILFFLVLASIKPRMRIKPSKFTKIVAALCVIIMVLPYAQMVTDVDNDSQALSRLGPLGFHVYDVAQLIAEAEKDEYDFTSVIDEKRDYYTHKNNQLYGVARGKNVIVLQVEALQDFVLERAVNGQLITPFLNELLFNDSIYFNNYFQVLGRGNTSDAEFVSHNSLYPSTSIPSYERYQGKTFYTLPQVLSSEKYHTVAFHGNVGWFWNRDAIYPEQGFDVFMDSTLLKMDEKIGMGLSDTSLYRQVVHYLDEVHHEGHDEVHQETQREQFYAFVVTLTSHHPFTLPKELIQLDPGEPWKGTLLGHYLQSMNYVDRTIASFFQQLKEKGLYDNSIIAIYGDHFGIAVADAQNSTLASEYLGYKYNYEEMLNVPLIVHIPGLNRTIRKSITGGHIDFFPTMLNLLGTEKKNHAVLLGRDLLNSDYGFVAQPAYMVKGSYIDNNIIFSMAADGIFENSKAWYLDSGEPYDITQCKEGYERAVLEFKFSEWLLENNLVGKQLQ